MKKVFCLQVLLSLPRALYYLSLSLQQFHLILALKFSFL